MAPSGCRSYFRYIGSRAAVPVTALGLQPGWVGKPSLAQAAGSSISRSWNLNRSARSLASRAAVTGSGPIGRERWAAESSRATTDSTTALDTQEFSSDYCEEAQRVAVGRRVRLRAAELKTRSPNLAQISACEEWVGSAGADPVDLSLGGGAVARNRSRAGGLRRGLAEPNAPGREPARRVDSNAASRAETGWCHRNCRRKSANRCSTA